jgi:hypothetical protein
MFEPASSTTRQPRYTTAISVLLPSDEPQGRIHNSTQVVIFRIYTTRKVIALHKRHARHCISEIRS